MGGAVAEGVREEELDELGRRLGGTGTTDMRVTGQPLAVQRDLAIAPTVPDAPAPVLTEAEIERAIRYNARRFVDPFTVSFVRDVLGVPKYPAVSDRDLALAAARYQADFGLTPDGRIGVATTRRLVAELNAEDQRRFARLLRADNMVTWTDVNAANWTGCGQFQWDVNFTTTLREGWLIQRIDNTWNATACGPGGGDVTPTFTRRYWEAGGRRERQHPTAHQHRPAPQHDRARRRARSLAQPVDPRLARQLEPGGHDVHDAHAPTRASRSTGRTARRGVGRPALDARADRRPARAAVASLAWPAGGTPRSQSGEPFPPARVTGADLARERVPAAPGADGWSFDPVPLLRAVNALAGRAGAEALDVLRESARADPGSTGVVLARRALRTRRPRRRVARARTVRRTRSAAATAGPGLERLPLVLEAQVPFLLVGGYRVGGAAGCRRLARALRERRAAEDRTCSRRRYRRWTRSTRSPRAPAGRAGPADYRPRVLAMLRAQALRAAGETPAEADMSLAEAERWDEAAWWVRAASLRWDAAEDRFAPQPESAC